VSLVAHKHADELQHPRDAIFDRRACVTSELQVVADRCLAQLHDKALQIDPGQSTWFEDGFAWHPGPVEQSVRATVLSPDPQFVRLKIQTRLLRSPEPPAAGELEEAQMLGTLSALGYTDASTFASFELLVYPELVDWQLRLASYVSALQIAEARHLLSALPLGRPNFQPVPAPAIHFDSIVNVGDFLAQRSYELADAIVTPEAVALAAQFVHGTLEPAGADDVFVIKRPWTVLPDEAVAAFGTYTVDSYVGLTGHPMFGPGFGVRSFFPLLVDAAAAPELAGVLNTDEHGWLAPRVGAWIAQSAMLFVQTFLPAGMLEFDDAGAMLGNMLSYHERMMRPGLEAVIDYRN